MRFTTRKLMTLVALIAALLAAFEAGRRWERSEHVGVTTFSKPYTQADVARPPPQPEDRPAP